MFLVGRPTIDFVCFCCSSSRKEQRGLKRTTNSNKGTEKPRVSSCSFPSLHWLVYGVVGPLSRIYSIVIHAQAITMQNVRKRDICREVYMMLTTHTVPLSLSLMGWELAMQLSARQCETHACFNSITMRFSTWLGLSTVLAA